MFSRRHFLGSVTAAASALGFPRISYSAQELHGRVRQRPRHIIHLVADGMSLGTLTCADMLSRIERGRGLTWLNLYNQGTARSGLMNMRSLNSFVTDSSAASSSWGCGARIMNGKLNQMRDGRPLTTLYELFSQAGWRRGLVTTAEITHATPAGFAANSDSRDTADVIASQYLDRRVDILLGGGRRFFEAKERKDKRDLLTDYRRGGYYVMESLAELNSAETDRRWLGVFDSGHLPFTLDHRNDAKKLQKIPTLAAMTSRALQWLGGHSHFVLQVEGARVDHGAHNCDAAAALYDQIAFDEAIDVCLAFQREEPETLLVITTDHGNGNLGLNGAGDQYGQSPVLFRNLLQIKRSLPEILNRVRKTEKAKIDDFAAKEAKAKSQNPAAHPHLASAAMSSEDIAKAKAKKEEKDVIFVKPLKEIIDVIYESTGYKLSERRAALLAPYLAKKGASLYEGVNSETAALGQIMANHLGISFASGSHTADYVPILAMGPGSEQFQGFIQNTEVFYRYLAFGKIDFRNPAEPELVDAGPSASEVEHPHIYQLV